MYKLVNMVCQYSLQSILNDEELIALSVQNMRHASDADKARIASARDTLKQAKTDLTKAVKMERYREKTERILMAKADKLSKQYTKTAKTEEEERQALCLVDRVESAYIADLTQKGSLFSQLTMSDESGGFYLDDTNGYHLEDDEVFAEVFDAKSLTFIVNRLAKAKEIIVAGRTITQDSCDARRYLTSSKHCLGCSRGVNQISVSYKQKWFKDSAGDSGVVCHRYNALHALSGQAMVREIRQPIFKDRYVDIDIVNAHPNIVRMICKHIGLECAVMDEYCENRDKHIADMIAVNDGADKGCCKVWFIMNMYGCGETKHDYFDWTNKERKIVHTEFTKTFRQRFDLLSQQICERFKRDYEFIREYKVSATKDDTRTYHGSCISHLCNYFENQLMLRVMDYIKYNEPSLYKHCILCFDGVMVYRGNKRQLTDSKIDAMLHRINKDLDLLGCGVIQFITKPMDNDSILRELHYNADDEMEDLVVPEDNFQDDADIITIKHPTKTYILTMCLIQRVKDLSYRREYGTGAIYVRETAYYYKRQYSDINQFFNTIFTDRERIFISSGQFKELTSWVLTNKHDDFKFIRPNMDYIGFTNGVYNLKSATFYDVDHIPEDIQVRTMLTTEYSECETPLFDAYLRYQFEEEDDFKFIQFVVGRAMSRIRDKFDFMVLLKGMAGSGKSLLLNLIRSTYDSSQVGILSASFERQFGLSNFTNTEIVICDDIPKDLAGKLDRGDYLSMCTCGPISAPVKNNRTVTKIDRFDQPLVWCGNALPNYTDFSGEIVRRAMVIDFSKIVDADTADNNLFDKIIKHEFGSVINKCRTTYLDYMREYGSSPIETFIPKTFMESRSDTREELNVSYEFAKNKMVYCEGNILYKSEMVHAFKDHLADRFGRRSMSKINEADVCRADPRYKYVVANHCKHCNGRHLVNCCDQYSRDSRIIRRYFLNVRLASDMDDVAI